MSKEEKIKVSIIVKTFNSQDTLCDTLESLRDFDEVIAVDEHSVDDTTEIIKEYRAKVIFASKNEFSFGFNQAINEAKNDWIFLVKDNEVIPQKLVFEIQKYIENPKKNKNVVAFSKKTFYLNKEIKAARKKEEPRLFKKGSIEFKDDFSLKTINGKIHKINKSFKIQNAYILSFKQADVSKNIQKIIEENKSSLKTTKRKKASLFLRPSAVFIYWYFLKGALFDGYRGFLFSKEKYFKSFIFETMLLEKGENNDF